MPGLQDICLPLSRNVVPYVSATAWFVSKVPFGHAINKAMRGHGRAPGVPWAGGRQKRALPGGLCVPCVGNFEADALGFRRAPR